MAEAGLAFAWILAALFVALVFVLGYLFPVLRPRRETAEEDPAEGEVAEARSAERGRTTQGSDDPEGKTAGHRPGVTRLQPPAQDSTGWSSRKGEVVTGEALLTDPLAVGSVVTPDVLIGVLGLAIATIATNTGRSATNAAPAKATILCARDLCATDASMPPLLVRVMPTATASRTRAEAVNVRFFCQLNTNLDTRGGILQPVPRARVERRSRTSPLGGVGSSRRGRCCGATRDASVSYMRKPGGV